MDHLLFQTQEDWSVDDPDPIFIDLAGDVGLDTATFATCLASRAPLERVLADMYDAAGVVTQTPTFIIIHSGTGARFEGFRSAADFVAILQAQLDSATDGGS